MHTRLIELAVQVRDAVASQNHRIVFVESCTGGWLAASMATIPGISQWWCGSLVVYRCGSKHRWLGIENSLLDDPLIGPVSLQVTQQLAERALERTAEADLAVAVTGDLGPGVIPEKDGIVYFALAKRDQSIVITANTRLTRPTPRDSTDIAARVSRLEEASAWIFEQTLQAMS